MKVSSIKESDVILRPMSTASLSRRAFLATASAAGAAAMLPLSARAAQQSGATRWLIGSHTRPFSSLRLGQDELLDAIKAAGFKSADMISAAAPVAPPAGVAPPPPAPGGGQGRGATVVTPESTAALKAKLAARGLVSTIASISVPVGVPLEEAITATRQQITNAQALGQKYGLYLGMGREDQYMHVTKVLSDAAAFAKERGIQLAIKHHHGLNNTSGELVGWVRQVNNPNFGIFLDPGNVIYYTGKDPVAQLEIIGPYLMGIVAKDCAGPHFLEREAGAPPFGSSVPDPRGDEVMIQFGTGKVDFAGLFTKLKSMGFNGPIMIEGTKPGATAEETIANARANRELLERTMAST
jgi:sugar phosphate isomerase/epimerase